MAEDHKCKWEEVYQEIDGHVWSAFVGLRCSICGWTLDPFELRDLADRYFEAWNNTGE